MSGAAWNWNAVTPAQPDNTNQAQGQRDVQVITMDWRDILGSAQSQGGATTSSTSPFIFPRTDNAYSNQQQQGASPGSGYYSGTGIRQEVDGQQPATFRIAVGNPGNLGSFLSQGQGSNGFYSHGHNGGQPYSSAGAGDTGGSNINNQPRIVMLPNAKVPIYQPCGNCQACCHNQPDSTSRKGSNAGKTSTFLCRSSPANLQQ